MNKGAKRVAIGTMLAGLAGYLAGILTAPKSGRDTRATIKDAANTGVRQAERQLKQLHTELNDLLNKAQDRGDRTRGRADQEWEGTVDSAKSAKRKVREVLSAIHEGDADDKDLQKAVKEATKAIDHLRSYLKK